METPCDGSLFFAIGSRRSPVPSRRWRGPPFSPSRRPLLGTGGFGGSLFAEADASPASAILSAEPFRRLPIVPLQVKIADGCLTATGCASGVSMHTVATSVNTRRKCLKVCRTVPRLSSVTATVGPKISRRPPPLPEQERERCSRGLSSDWWDRICVERHCHALRPARL